MGEKELEAWSGDSEALLLQTTANETGRREEGNCGSPEYGFQQQQQQQHVERRGDAVNFSLPPLTTVSNLQTVRKEVRGD